MPEVATAPEVKPATVETAAKDDPNNPYFKLLPAEVDVVRRDKNKEEIKDKDGNPVKWKFVRTRLKSRGKESKVRYALQPAFPKTQEEREMWFNWVLPEQLLNTSHAKVSGMSSNWTDSATKYEGENPIDFSENMFADVVGIFSARGETIKSLLIEKEDINGKIVELAADTKLTMPEKLAAMTELGNRLKEVMESIEDRKRSNSPDKDDEASE